METILNFLPKKIAELISQIPPNEKEKLEEIRIRMNRPVEMTLKGEPRFLSYLIQPEDAVHLMNKISNFSIYTLEEELKRGYITVSGGHRIGLAGKVILEEGRVKAIRDISSFNIRIAREKVGIAEPLIPYLYQRNWMHTMVIGPPQTGKTTLLRDIARIISSGNRAKGFQARKVGIVDERSEIAGCVNGVPQLTFGHRLDVLDACPKAEGMMMMIRSMSPEVLIADEIGRMEDAEAIQEAVHAGIKLITTTHGTSMEEIRKRPSLRAIIDQRIFERFVILSREAGPGTIKHILDGNGHEMKHKVRVT
ncbi:stage III sporulation protein AA [Neobacillus vireti]|uniref:Stage III sporulation protein AA n=1 Tax=Neobacillus vireti LMG 21834 TaxID=1131730 RepID=A0AB94IK52_9BACI|nr:stage III sporulation protein AA [Neobacillus vireti]ETI67367.1 stage III sporulation protein AA [Neobacillus vireti LMG 21834]KLT17037.1 stage III sporulation protein AA [Neobacillus vireti]